MTGAWLGSIEQIWQSPQFPFWLTLGVAGFFALAVLVLLLRAPRSLANAALALIAVAAIGVAGLLAWRDRGDVMHAASPSTGPALSMATSLAALACLDELAGEAVLNACERVLFASPENVAAAVTATQGRIARLIALNRGAEHSQDDIAPLRRGLGRDRYGLAAYVLATHYRCRPSECSVFSALGDYGQIANNMTERVYEGMVMRHSTDWGVPPVSASAALPVGLPGLAAMGASMPSGKPTTAEFPTANSIPPVNIMTAEPQPASQAKPSAAASARPAAAAPAAAKNASAGQNAASDAQAAARPPAPAKKPPPKPRPAPVQIAPEPPASEE